MPSEMNLFGGSKAEQPKSIITLYHGSPAKDFTPTFGFGKDNHDYGRGFYLTPKIELAKEWATGGAVRVSTECWVHTYTLDVSELLVFDFETVNVVHWIAELLRHRTPSDLGRRRYICEALLDKYSLDTSSYDVIRGWRADDSYFKIASHFLSDDICVDDLRPLLHLGKLGIQFCIKTPLAYSKLQEVSVEQVDYQFYRKKFDHRDFQARALFDNYARTHRYGKRTDKYCSDLLRGDFEA